MDENALEISIKQYKQQLQQIEGLLKENQDCDDLISLKNDLLELIKTTEESLLCVKKSNLLKLLEDTEEPVQETNDSDDCEQQDNLLEFKEIEDAVNGTQCQAPYTFSWGVTSFYNAMIFDIASFDEETQQLKVRVLFTNPTHQSMLPCPYFLEGKCRFNDDQCRFSHGCIVPMNELKEYKEPDFSLLKVNDKCLAKYEDDIWYKATILSLTSDTVKIHYDTYNVDKTLNLEEVLPTNFGSQDLSDDESSDENEIEHHVIAEFYDNKNDENTGILGDWEKHTKGIASKLMAQMGYVVGQGLGKNSDGRVDPVEIILLPTGKSLDACAELREKKMLKEPFKKRKIKSKNSTEIQVSKTDVFEFINKTLGGKKGDIHHINQKEKAESVDKKTASKLKTQREYNIELCKLEQEKNKLQKEVKKQKNSISRNEKDARVTGHAKQKLDNLYSQIKRIENQEKLVKQKINQNNEHKKLTVF